MAANICFFREII